MQYVYCLDELFMMNLKSVNNTRYKAADNRHGLRRSPQACTNKNYAVTPVSIYSYSCTTGEWCLRNYIGKVDQLVASWHISFEKATTCTKNSVGYPIQSAL